MEQQDPCPDCGRTHPDEIHASLDIGVWQDGIGKHLRFSITDVGVSATISILPVAETQVDGQADALLGLLVNLPELVAEALDAAFAAWEAEGLV